MTTTSRPRFTLPTESSEPSVTPSYGASAFPRDVVFPFQRAGAIREDAQIRSGGSLDPLLRRAGVILGLVLRAGAGAFGYAGALASLFAARLSRRSGRGAGPLVSTESRPVAPFPFQSAGREFAFVYRCAICRCRVETSEALLESCSLCIACFYRPEVAA